MRPIALLAFSVLLGLAACDTGDGGGDGADAGAPDGRPDSAVSGSTEASGRIWCEDGEVYQGQLLDLAQPEPVGCSVDDPGRWQGPPTVRHTCEHGCAIADGGPGCESCYGHDGGTADCYQDPVSFCAP